jgi:AcrR family transcriptional regulator
MTPAAKRPGRKREILERFTVRMAVQGYDQTSSSEIARDLGLSKGTVMHHYGSKDRLLRQMSLEYMQRRLTEVTSCRFVLSGTRDSRLKSWIRSCSRRLRT